MGQTTTGLYPKFKVARLDGRDVGGDREDAEYFVLDLTYDPFALEALKAYARACKSRYSILSHDLLVKVHHMQEDYDDISEAEAFAMGYTHRRRGCDADCPVCHSAAQGATP